MVWSHDWGGEAAWNMAVDEVLYRGGNKRQTAWIRCYSWARQSVSIGYFSKLSEVGDLRERDVVRRLTGGGVVEHGKDLTFSVSIPAGHAWARMRGTDLYAYLHGAVSEALRSLCGATGVQLAGKEDVSRGAGGYCFERPVLADVLADGRKVVGGAMKRGREGVIYQGSVQIDGLGEAFASALVSNLTGGGAVQRCGVFTGDQLDDAGALVETRYSNEAWLRRR